MGSLVGLSSCGKIRPMGSYYTGPGSYRTQRPRPSGDYRRFTGYESDHLWKGPPGRATRRSFIHRSMAVETARPTAEAKGVRSADGH